MGYKGKLKNSIYWYLSKHKPFIIEDQYQVELLFVDKQNNSAKILITNLKNNDTTEEIVEFQDDYV